MAETIALVALAGALGTLARYFISTYIQTAGGPHFPWGTAAVNLIGCFLFGFLWTAIGSRWQLSLEWQRVIFVGFLGAFTTYSTYVFEVVGLVNANDWMRAGVYFAGINGVGIVLLVAGALLGRMM